jgi:hypothetical protein
MVRDVAILGAAMLALQVACPAAQAAPVPEANGHKAHHGAAASAHIALAHKKFTRRHIDHPVVAEAPPEVAIQFAAPEVETANGAPTSLAFHAAAPEANPVAEPSPKIAAKHPVRETAAVEPAADIPLLPSTPPLLSDQESEAGRLANAQGDRTFIMVDKALGKVILFQNGQPVYAGPALTGASTADIMPKTELTANFDTLNATNTKITPAGRYTVQRGFDPEVGGPLFDIHEIRGKDWGIAIHQLYLGIPSEHRDVRILSPSDEDKHITFGCINVTTPTMRVLMHELPVKGLVPLYILPEDVSQTAAFLTTRVSS